MPSDAYLAMMGLAPRRIPHWEHMSNPDFVERVTGIDPYEKPRSAYQRLSEVFKIDLGLGIPKDDKPMTRFPADQSVFINEAGDRCVRWGAGLTSHWEWGRKFATIEDVLDYQPLENLDLRDAKVVESRDYSLNDEAFYRLYAGDNPRPSPPEGEVASAGFYNTMFMWLLLTFGWERCLELIGGYPKETKRLLADFAVINRKVFRTFARLPVNCVVCHDDICMARGPVCSPEWLREYIYPYYEEFWAMLRAAGKRVIFMSDGNIDQVADDIAACGADGFVSEPFADWKAIARKHPDKVVAGEGDNRILMRNDRAEIEAMVRSMVETAQICGGYFMCIGNHIPWNVPAEAVETYFRLSAQLAHR
jgi:hypothetical protein